MNDINIELFYPTESFSGQGLAASSAEWDGKIEVEETIGRVEISYGGGLQSFADMVQVEVMNPNPVSIGEVIGRIQLGGFPRYIESGDL